MSVDSDESVAVAFQRHWLESVLFGREDAVRLGRYALRRRVGEGGMGSVYEAYDPELDRRVAVKVLHKQYTDDRRAKQRLVREATTMARLSHPHVVEVFEVGEERGEVYIAMELVDGAPLSEWLETPRSLDEICSVFIDAARGLAAAHAAGVVHRDFKPHNVLVDRRGWAKVMDFGLAGDFADVGTDPPSAPRPEEGSARSGSLTRTGAQLGTPHYMSPEQHRGLDVGPKSDQWNYCVTLHEALHGTLPFAGETLEELRASVAAQRIRAGDRRVPSWLDAIVRRGLQPDPDARFASMDDVAEALRRGPRARAWSLLLPAAAVAAIVAAVTTKPNNEMCEAADARLAGVWDAERKTGVLGSLRAANASDAVTAQLSEALDAYAERWVATHTGVCESHRDADPTDASTFDATMSCLRGRRASLSALVELAGQSDGESASSLVAASASLPPPERCTDEAWLDDHEPLPDDPSERAEYEAARDALTRADIRRVGGDHVGARQALDELLTTLRPRGPSTLLAQTLVARGRGTDAAEEAVRYLDEAYWMAERVGDWRVAFEAANTLVLATGGGLNQYDEAMRWAGYARAARRRRGLEPDAQLLTHEGMALEAQGKLNEALTRYEAAVATDEVRADPDSVQFAGPHLMLGEILVKLERHAEALPHLRRGYHSLLQEFGPEAAKTAYAEAAVGDALRSIGDLEGALVHHRHALDAVSDHPDVGPDHPRTADYLQKLARTLAAMGQYDDALGYAQKAVRVAEAAYGSQHPTVAGKEELVGNVLVHLEREDEALEVYQRAQATYEAALPAGHPSILQNQQSLAGLYLRRKDHARALPMLEELLDAFVRLQGEGSERVAGIRFQLARAAWASGQPDRARELARTAADAYRRLGDGYADQTAEVVAWLADHEKR